MYRRKKVDMTMQSNNWRRLRVTLAAAPLAVLSIGLTPSPSAASPLPVGVDQTPQCDITSFAQTDIIDAGGSSEDPSEVASDQLNGGAVGATDILDLDTPIPAGTVLVSGTSNDPDHAEDSLDGDPTLTESGEKVIVRFVGEGGATVGETLPTPDLPDTATGAPFAQPSIDLSGPAHGVQLVHAGDGTSANKFRVGCLNIDPITSDSPPSDLIRFLTCTDEEANFAPDLTCGFMAVPEERSDPDSRFINIAFGIVSGGVSTAEPLVYLDGGPGGAPLSASNILQELAFSEVAAGRDMIYVDQRGTGYSQPQLVCVQLEDLVFEQPPFEDLTDSDDIEGAEPPTDEEIMEAIREESQQCKDRLVEQQIDLSAYTTVENAADINDLRLGLGIDTWNLFGGSYGTDLALSIMRDHPEGVNSAILDSVFQPEISAGPDDLISYQNNLDQIVERCLADDDCGAAFPNLADDINTAAANVVREPVPYDDENVEFILGDVLDITTFASIMVLLESEPSLPAWINGLASDDPNERTLAAQNYAQTFLALIFGATPADAAAMMSYQQLGLPSVATMFSDGFFASVVCAEEFPYQSPTIPRASDMVWSPALLDAATNDFFPVCDIWDVRPEDPIVTEAVTSDIPTLVYASDTDFQTWPEWSSRAAETLPNSTLVEFPQLGHVVTIGNECPISIATAFVNDPAAKPDASCAAQLPQIDYAGSLVPAPTNEEIVEIAEEAGADGIT